MSKTLAKIAAHTNISSRVQDLLATCLKIPIPEDINNYTWVENCAGVRIGKIKQGEYSIYTLHGVLYSIMSKMIEPNPKNSKPTKFMLFSGNNPISLMVDTISQDIHKRHGIISKKIMNVIYNNTIIIDQPVIRLVKCEDIEKEFCKAANKYDVFNIYKRWPDSDEYAPYYIKIMYDESGIKYNKYLNLETQFNIDLIMDLFGYEIYNYVLKYYNSYIYNKLHKLLCLFDKSVLSKLCKLYYGYKRTYMLKDGNYWIDLNYLKHSMYKVRTIQHMCRDRMSAFKSIGRYVPTGPVALLFEI
jgi:hypothetical protein